MKSKKWLRPSQMAKKYNKSLQLVNYWKKTGKLKTMVTEHGHTLVQEAPSFKPTFKQ